jgi:hypothetical protein
MMTITLKVLPCDANPSNETVAVSAFIDSSICRTEAKRRNKHDDLK